MKADLVFLPWLQRGAATALEDQDALGPDQRGRHGGRQLACQRRARRPDAAPGHGPRARHGSADRAGDPHRSRRWRPGVRAELLPARRVRRAQPALAVHARRRRLRRQAAAVAVPRRSCASRRASRLDPHRRGSLPVLRIASPAQPSAELPDLKDSWAWAHAQVTAEADTGPDPFAGLIDGDPTRSLSRLVCGRILARGHRLPRLCRADVRAGPPRRTRRADHRATMRAVSTRPGPSTPDLDFVELPVYHHWSFATGAGGDFQSLAMLLRARPLPEGVGLRPYDVSKSGVTSDGGDPTVLSLGGALRPVDLAPQTWPDETQHERFRRDVADIVNLPVTTGEDEPLLAPPRYGAIQARLGAVDPNRNDRWFEQLNLEPAARMAAQFGTEVVQQHQELLMASAWDQVDGLADVNRVLRHAQLHLAVATSLHVRHVARLQPDAGAAAAGTRPRSDQPSAGGPPPRHRAGGAARPDRSPGRSLRHDVATGRQAAGRTDPAAPASRGEQGVTRPRRRPSAVLTHLQPEALLSRSRPASPGSGPVTIEAVALSMHPPRPDIAWSEADATTVTDTPPRPRFAVVPFVWPREPIVPPFDSHSAARRRRRRSSAVVHIAADPTLDGPTCPAQSRRAATDRHHRTGPTTRTCPTSDAATLQTRVTSPSARRSGTVPRPCSSAPWRRAHLSRFYPPRAAPDLARPARSSWWTSSSTRCWRLPQPRPAFHANILTLVDLKGLSRGDERGARPRQGRTVVPAADVGAAGRARPGPHAARPRHDPAEHGRAAGDQHPVRGGLPRRAQRRARQGAALAGVPSTPGRDVLPAVLGHQRRTRPATGHPSARRLGRQGARRHRGRRALRDAAAERAAAPLPERDHLRHQARHGPTRGDLSHLHGGNAAGHPLLRFRPRCAHHAGTRPRDPGAAFGTPIRHRGGRRPREGDAPTRVATELSGVSRSGCASSQCESRSPRPSCSGRHDRCRSRW